MGLDTQRSIAEDSLRERGEWLGDAVTASLPLLHHGWQRTDLVRRTLRHAADGARADGLVAGCGPGELHYLGTYAMQWTTACLQLARFEQSDEMLRELVDSGRANVRAISAAIDTDGRHRLPWCFVDWGYAVDNHQPDAAVLAHAAIGVRSWIRWLELLRHDGEAGPWRAEADRLDDLVRRHLPDSGSRYQAVALAALAGVITPGEAAPTILESLHRGFPYDRAAPRLNNPTTWAADAVTPYFTNFSVPVLLDAGRGPEVRDLWRSCWGWMLDEGATTWWEVFDDRWSRCHAWSGAPTWQLSERVLGLQPNDMDGWRVQVNTLGLTSVSGVVPLDGGRVRVSWHAEGDHVAWRAESDRPLRLAGHQPGPVVERVLQRVRGDLFA